MRPKGFTLVEVLIAVLIVGIVLSTVYASYTGTFRLIRSGQQEGRIYRTARSALERMTRDLQALAPWAGGYLFRARLADLGRRQVVQLMFRSAAHVSFEPQGVPEGVAVIEYVLQEEAEKEGMTLLRNDSLFRDPTKDAQPDGFPLCEGIESLTYVFLDEAGKEYDSWDSLQGSQAQRKRAPSQVVIRLSMVNPDDEKQPYRFLTAVRLPRVEAQ